ncbi:hypothetical protein OROMI_008217 [Orobanche minor]
MSSLEAGSGLFQPPLGEKILRKANFRMLSCSSRGCSGCYEWRKLLSDVVWNRTFVVSGHHSFKCFSSSVAQFVDGLFKSITYHPSFQDCIRDFLVKSKEFSAQISNEVVRRMWNKL